MNTENTPKFEIDLDQLRLWIAALRSGEYKQTRGKLQTLTGYCCLGVGVCVLVPHDKIQLDSLGLFIVGSFPNDQPNAPQWLKEINDHFSKHHGNALTSLNDNGKHSFKEIADLLEKTYLTDGNQ